MGRFSLKLKRILMLAIPFAVLITSFQNCGPQLKSQSNTQMGGVGTDGKMRYVNYSVCSNNKVGVSSAVVVDSNFKSAVQTRENCEDLASPRVIDISSIQFASNDASVFQVDGKVFDQQVATGVQKVTVAFCQDASVQSLIWQNLGQMGVLHGTVSPVAGNGTGDLLVQTPPMSNPNFYQTRSGQSSQFELDAAAKTLVYSILGGPQVSAANLNCSSQSTPPALISIAHASALTSVMVGPEALGVPIAQLRPVPITQITSISSWPSDGVPSWIPNSIYVYNNDPNNHGGIVPPGGLMIDGFFVPAGVLVAQYNNFGNGVIDILGDNNGASPAFPGIVFRGCSWRGTSTDPGFINVEPRSHTKLWVLFSDAGGLGAAGAQLNETALAMKDVTSNAIFFRNYVSYTMTGINALGAGPQILENYVEKLTQFAGVTTGVTGINLGGGQANATIIRNKVLIQSPDEAGHTTDRVACISMFQDAGSFPGTGFNTDGSQGYLIKDNFVGGGEYSLIAGKNSSQAANSVQNLVLTGNQVTNQWWPNGGSSAPLGFEPVWGSFGNTKSGNSIIETGAGF